MNLIKDVNEKEIRLKRFLANLFNVSHALTANTVETVLTSPCDKCWSQCIRLPLWKKQS